MKRLKTYCINIMNKSFITVILLSLLLLTACDAAFPDNNLIDITQPDIPTHDEPGSSQDEPNPSPDNTGSLPGKRHHSRRINVLSIPI